MKTLTGMCLHSKATPKVFTSAKEAMFLPESICFLVGWFDCTQDYCGVGLHSTACHSTSNLFLTDEMRR